MLRKECIRTKGPRDEYVCCETKVSLGLYVSTGLNAAYCHCSRAVSLELIHSAAVLFLFYIECSQFIIY